MTWVHSGVDWQDPLIEYVEQWAAPIGPREGSQSAPIIRGDPSLPAIGIEETTRPASSTSDQTADLDVPLTDIAPLGEQGPTGGQDFSNDRNKSTPSNKSFEQIERADASVQHYLSLAESAGVQKNMQELKHYLTLSFKAEKAYCVAHGKPSGLVEAWLGYRAVLAILGRSTFETCCKRSWPD